MSKFRTIGISSLVALHPKVEIHKFLGMFERVNYQPTHSAISSYRNYYNVREAELLQQIADTEQPAQGQASVTEIHTADNGDYRLDLCMSADCEFVAFQVFVRKRGEYEPFSKLCFLEGESARIFEDLLA